jgi:hypothetical protein
MSSRITETLAAWRELERAIEAIHDSELRAALERRIAEVRAEYQEAVRQAEDQTPPLHAPARSPDLA